MILPFLTYIDSNPAKFPIIHQLKIRCRQTYKSTHDGYHHTGGDCLRIIPWIFYLLIGPKRKYDIIVIGNS